MKSNFKNISGSINAPVGFRAGSVFCDIKKLGTGKGSEKGDKHDLALVCSDTPAAVAGMFTTSQVRAAPVKISVERAARKSAQAILINSGNANACTGSRGMAGALEMTNITARLLEIPEEHVLVCSTGRIGVQLPMENVRGGIDAVVKALGSSHEYATQAAEAIMTTDTRRKETAVEFELDGRSVKIGGICKGAGMIQPGMSRTSSRPAATPLHATMLCVITTDAAVEGEALKSALACAVANSFNRITIDGDMSTNDSVIALANGQAGNEPLSLEAGDCERFGIFQDALNQVTLELAKMIVRDGEGVSKFITIRVGGAESFADADAAARSVANSALVKTSWCGGDPNWGRIMGALGYSNARIDEESVDIGYSRSGDAEVRFALEFGKPAVDLESLKEITVLDEFDIHINLNRGDGEAVVYTCDLTEAYVDFNKGE
ncbi:MAG: bifunctional glutamate N-acetyltransferase/amino-acid acetyltransferase ArgJ [Verrucomicrobia bacterium]|nr:bifunctional glutamate N-acetyltransferase/amino-acid acetyltransferase ArgJ [Verrucomicrobiota bacterium]